MIETLTVNQQIAHWLHRIYDGMFFVEVDLILIMLAIAFRRND